MKGALFETVVASLLKSSGYKLLPSSGSGSHLGKLRGRGTWHQIDAFGFYEYGVPCLYPIRVIAEAKCYAKEAGLPTIRNFVGAFKDIAENYFVEDGASPGDYLLTKRYTDAAAMFSAHGFTKDAQDYAYAQGVFLVSYEQNPVLSPVLNAIDRLLTSVNIEAAAKSLNDFKIWAESKIEQPVDSLETDHRFLERDGTISIRELSSRKGDVRSSYLGTAGDVLPVHILSSHEIPWNIFVDSDRTTCRIHYYQGFENCLEIEPVAAPGSRFYISVPWLVVEKFVDRMTNFKQRFLRHIDFPVRRGSLENGIRRILRFELDLEWLNRIRSSRARRVISSK